MSALQQGYVCAAVMVTCGMGVTHTPAAGHVTAVLSRVYTRLLCYHVCTCDRCSVMRVHVLCAGGLLYFGAGASGTDQLEYNAHRIYGPVRLPLMTANWEVLGVYDANVKRDQCGGSTCNDVFARWRKVSLGNFGFQPVIVMRNMRTTPCSVTSAVTGE